MPKMIGPCGTLATINSCLSSQLETFNTILLRPKTGIVSPVISFKIELVGRTSDARFEQITDTEAPVSKIAVVGLLLMLSFMRAW